MNCHEARLAIPKLIDGLLNQDNEFLVRQHINGCAECRAVLAEYEQDEQLLTNYMRHAPYPSVARDVVAEMDRQRSPWWDAFRAGSYRLASVAGLVMVILVVGAGAWAVREVATSDEPADEEPRQEAMIGTTDEEPQQVDTFSENEPPMVGMDEIDRIVNELDQEGLVFPVEAQNSTDDYSILLDQIAVDRHLTLVSYDAQRTNGAPLELDVSVVMDDEVATRGISLEEDSQSGWLVFPTGSISVSSLEIEVNRSDESGSDILSHTVDVDLSPIDVAMSTESYESAAAHENGIELCCVEIERGVAISLFRFEERIEDENSLAAANQAPGMPADIQVNGEPVTQLSPQYGLGSMDTQRQTVPLLMLPDEGELTFDLDYLTLGEDARDGAGSQTVEGPWSLTVTLGDPGAEPEPQPTEPPMIATEPSPTAEPEVMSPEPSSDPTPVPTEEVDNPETLHVLVYLVRGDELGVSSREIAYTQDVATASLEELLDGPTPDDENYELGTEVPAGTNLLDISLSDGVVTVDLSSEFSLSETGGESLSMRMAQVVHTLTQFNTVDSVEILVEGQPVAPRGGAMGDAGIEHYTRADFESEAPAILIESPAPGEVVSDQIRLRGTANTFEATLQIEVIGPDEEVLYRDHDMASSGTGTRGEFDISVPVDPESDGWGTVRMFEHSARDGSRTNVVDIPVQFEADS